MKDESVICCEVLDKYQLTEFDAEDFLKNYWQKKPGIFRQVLPGFVDPLDEHELAGLAQGRGQGQEEYQEGECQEGECQEDEYQEVEIDAVEIDSRIVSQSTDGRWNVSHGPFDDYQEVCSGAWTLLVQAVDRHIPEAHQLIQAFDFIPNWRRDDLMVSFSVKGAGVGPHLDQYDVFIIQGKGRRRWQLGLVGDYVEHIPHEDLKQIIGFTPVIDEVLQPGDMIYIPPGCPHNGVALETCLNYSVGFRAPSQQELIASFADYILDSGLFKQRYQDPALTFRSEPAEIKRSELEKIRGLVSELVASDHFEQWFGKFASERYELGVLSESESESESDEEQQNHRVEEVKQLLKQGAVFYRDAHACPVYFEVSPLIGDQTGDQFRFFVGGKQFSVSDDYKPMIKSFLNSDSWSIESIQAVSQGGDPSDSSDSFFELLAELVNLELWYFEPKFIS